LMAHRSTPNLGGRAGFRLSFSKFLSLPGIRVSLQLIWRVLIA
jgi:hypothetical protein